MMMMNFFCGMVDRRKAFPAGTIVRDPHHRESPTRHEQGVDEFMSLDVKLIKSRLL